MGLRTMQVIAGVWMATGLTSALWASDDPPTKQPTPDSKPAITDPIGPPVSQPAAAPAASAEESPQERALRSWKSKLKGSLWTIELTPSGGEAGKPRADQLSFTDVQVTSQALTKDGFGSSNYTLRLDGDVATWETMQSKEGAVAFLRGEVHGDTMQGMFSKREGDVSKDYSFKGTRADKEPTADVMPIAPAQPATPAVSAKPAISQPVSPAVPAAQARPAAEPQPKKKRGWW